MKSSRPHYIGNVVSYYQFCITLSILHFITNDELQHQELITLSTMHFDVDAACPTNDKWLHQPCIASITLHNFIKKTLNLDYWRKTNTTNILLAKSVWTTLWYPLTDLYFETVEGIGFFYLCRNNFPNFRSYVGDTFRTVINWFHRTYPQISILSEIVMLCCLCKNIANNFRRLSMFYLKHFNSKTLDIFVMN